MHFHGENYPHAEWDTARKHRVRVGFRPTPQAPAWAGAPIQRFSIRPISFLIDFSYTRVE